MHHSRWLLSIAVLSCGCAASVVSDTEVDSIPPLTWAETIGAVPEKAIVGDAELRARIIATGLPWHVRDRATGIELILIPPGEFQRGAPEGEEDARPEEQPAHTAQVTEPFYLGRFEVTQAQWVRTMGEHPFDTEGADHPAENITVPQIRSFLEKTGFTLPTEVEWEWACRAGNPGPRYGPLGTIAWYRENSDGRTHPVGEWAPNGFGLCDVLGNVWELTLGDWTPSYESFNEAAPVSPESERASWRRRYYQSFRGGSWVGGPADLRAARRQRFSPGYGFYETGFRVRHGIAE